MGDKLRVTVWLNPAVARLTHLWPSWPRGAPVPSKVCEYMNIWAVFTFLLGGSAPWCLAWKTAYWFIFTLQNPSKHNWPMTRSMGFKLSITDWGLLLSRWNGLLNPQQHCTPEQGVGIWRTGSMWGWVVLGCRCGPDLIIETKEWM